jgi:two-component system, OmpR family, response regulator
LRFEVAARAVQTAFVMAGRVLVADDDAVTLALVSQTMEGLGLGVTCAEDGDELMQHIANDEPYDLVVTDVSMPWMTGLHVAHSARAAGLRTPMIVITALPIDAGEVTNLGSPVVLLRKPFRTKQLIAAAKQLLRHGERA